MARRRTSQQTPAPAPEQTEAATPAAPVLSLIHISEPTRPY